MYFDVKGQELKLDKRKKINTEKDKWVKEQVKQLFCDCFLVGGRTTKIINDELFFMLKVDEVWRNNQGISL